MNKSLLMSAITCLVVFLGAQSRATTFTDFEAINQQLTAGTLSNTYLGEFNIVDKGFQPGTQFVSSAQITFSLSDRAGAPVSNGFTINMDGGFSDSQYTSFLVLGNTQVSIDLLASLNADGILNFSVTATSGEFRLNSAELIAEVPDSGTTLTLGAIALAGVAATKLRAFKLC